MNVEVFIKRFRVLTPTACQESLSDTRHGNERPRNFGSFEHQADIWQWVKTSDVFQKKFDTVELGRWHNFTAKASRLRTFAGPLFFGSKG